jgi:hypothetical protein
MDIIKSINNITLFHIYIITYVLNYITLKSICRTSIISVILLFQYIQLLIIYTINF